MCRGCCKWFDQNAFDFFFLAYINSTLFGPTMDPFNFPAVGDARAVGSKFGSTSGTSTDIIYPVSKQIDEAFLPGRTLELAWKSDQHRLGPCW